jgi:hypothetical protein
MPRITLPAPDTMSPEQRAVYDKIVSGPRGRIQGPLRAALHNAELADKWQALGALLRYGTTLPPRLSEIAILVTGRACNSPFEWYAHRAEGEKAGIEQPILEACWPSPCRLACPKTTQPSTTTRWNSIATTRWLMEPMPRLWPASANAAWWN